MIAMVGINWQGFVGLILGVFAVATCLGQTDGPFRHEHKDQRRDVASSPFADGVVYEIHLLYLPKGKARFANLATRLPRLAELGVGTIYLMPFFQISGDPQGISDEQRFKDQYLIRDYRTIDPVYGTGDDLKGLIQEAHGHGIRVLFDMCLNHTHYQSVFFENGWTHQIPLSRLKSRAEDRGMTVQTEQFGRLEVVTVKPLEETVRADFKGILSGDRVHAFHYPNDQWWLAVDTANPDLIEYMVELTEYFVREYDFDGWRLDAPSNNWNSGYIEGEHSQLQLLREVARTLKRLKPDSVVITEDASSGHAVHAPKDFDEVADAACNAEFFLNTVATAGVKYPSIKQSLDRFIVDDLTNLLEQGINRGDGIRLRYSETHDTPRINKNNENLNQALLVFNVAFCPGVPMIHAGQEFGCKNLLHCLPDQGLSQEQNRLFSFYRKVIGIRNHSAAIRFGGFRNILVPDDGLNRNKHYACLRSFESEDAIVLVNFDSRAAEYTLNLEPTTRLNYCDQLNGELFDFSQSNIVSVPAFGARILLTAKTP